MHEDGDLQGCANFAHAAVRLTAALQAPGAASARLLRMIDGPADIMEGSGCSPMLHDTTNTNSAAHSAVTLPGALVVVV